MKYKAIGAAACAAVLLLGALNWQAIFKTDKKKRYQQHLDSPQKNACTLEHKDGELCTHLPLISIDTGARQIPGAGIVGENGEKLGFVTTTPEGADRITAKMAVMDSETEYNHTSDQPVISSEIVIHARGNSSRYFDKLGYRIKLIGSEGNANPQTLLGMDAHHEWALHGPFLDKTLIRNYMWYNISGEIMDYAPSVRFCELVINGEYMGIYVLTELIGKGDNGARLNLSVNAKKNTFSGYLLRLDRYDDSTYDWLRSLTTYTYRNDTDLKLEIEYPGEKNLTPELKTSIKDDFSRFEKALYSYDYDNSRYGYTKYIDVDSFVCYFLINEFSVNYDAGSYSTYIYKDVDGKFKVCVWDFNNSCDNYQETSLVAVQHFELQNKLWFGMLIKDEDFVCRIIDRYRELRKTYLSDEYLTEYIDSVISYLGPAIDRNFEKWGYSFEDDSLLSPPERNLRSYDEAITQLKRFLLGRGSWMDDNIETLMQYCADSKIKKYNEISD